ncbi:MAG: hypothetical protein JEZ09_15840 [Salinivirgaceae bacterium]|nr:hypothetical protein [Salinivirgaceae bacterium]
MKKFSVLILLCLNITIFGQNKEQLKQFLPTENSSRITQMETYHGSDKIESRFDYKYTKKGLLESITRKIYKNNSWLPQESKNYTYNFESNTIICIHKPSFISDGAIDFAKMRAFKKQIPESDTFKIANGKIIYMSQYRKDNYGESLKQFLYEYNNDLLTKYTKKQFTYYEDKVNGEKVRKLSLSPSLCQYTITNSNGRITELLQEESSIKRKWSVIWNDNIMEKINVYEIKDNTETLFNIFEVNAQDNNIIEIIDYMTNEENRSMVQKYSYKYNANNALTEYRHFDDSGVYVEKYFYEEGKGNAYLFIEKIRALDFFKPSIK